MESGRMIVNKRVNNNRKLVWETVNEVMKYHYEPIKEEFKGKKFPLNITLSVLSCIMKKNHLYVGEPGFGKTTLSKIIASVITGVPYDLYDATELRGHPFKYEGNLTGRLHFGKLNKEGNEQVIWVSTFLMPVLILDEVNRLTEEAQDVLLQPIDTGRINYLNASIYGGKKPAFLTANEKEERWNGFIPAFLDRIAIVTEQKHHNSLMLIFNMDEMKKNVEKDLCDPEFTNAALEALANINFDSFIEMVKERQREKAKISPEKQEEILNEISKMEMDNDAILFLASLGEEINTSNKYGVKRCSDPISDHSHDLPYLGVNVKTAFSPRSICFTLDYAKALAWLFEDDKVGLDHVRFILPHILAHKANFTDDYINAHGNDIREDFLNLYLSKCLVEQAFENYKKCIRPVKNEIAKIQKGEMRLDEAKKMLKDADHPLLKAVLKAFLDEESRGIVK
jgi:MoxR-like ATPase